MRHLIKKGRGKIRSRKCEVKHGKQRAAIKISQTADKKTPESKTMCKYSGTQKEERQIIIKVKSVSQR